MKAPDLDNITLTDLQDNERLAQLFVEAVRRRFTANTQLAVLEFWSQAEKALQDDTHGTPGKLFYALLKANETHHITGSMEERASHRMPSDKRQALVEYVDGGRQLSLHAEEQHDTFFGRNVGFAQSIMVQCFLPQRRLPTEEVRRGSASFVQPQSEYETSHGKATLQIKAGEIAHPEQPQTLMRRDIPYGANARLILPYICGAAVSNNSPVIDLGSSLRRYMTMLGLKVGGHAGNDIHEQIANIASARFVLGDWTLEQRADTSYAQVARHLTFWLERDDRQHALWTPEMELSPDFFEALIEHPVPLDMTHLVKCKGIPRLMDHYVWLSYRLPAETRKRGRPVPLADLHRIFGASIKSKYKYRAALEADLKFIFGLWSGGRAEVRGWNLWLYPSTPVLPRKVIQAIGLNNHR